MVPRLKRLEDAGCCRHARCKQHCLRAAFERSEHALRLVVRWIVGADITSPAAKAVVGFALECRRNMNWRHDGASGLVDPAESLGCDRFGMPGLSLFAHRF